MAALEAASFRDPSGHVFHLDNRIYRTVTAQAADDFHFVRDWLRELETSGAIVASTEVDPAVLGDAGAGVVHVLEHPKLPFISWPYEWSFPLLKSAALFHLDLQLKSLERGVTLSDASAYNIQFHGVTPIFIDTLSFRRYREGEFWTGHRQFCEQFVNPLLLRAFLGIPHNAWYRGALEGISGHELSRLLPLQRKLSWNVLTHVLLPQKLQARALGDGEVGKLKDRKLPKSALVNLLTQLKAWIAKLTPADHDKTLWGDYETESQSTYSDDNHAAKRQFIGEFARRCRPTLAWDLGCNTGDYSEALIEAGAKHVIGFDFDQGALEKAYHRAAAKKLDFLPLFLDAANPSPSQGWLPGERKGLADRAQADAVVALAFAHHLAIARNVPLEGVIGWLTSLAPSGVIEFVPKSDPTIQRMLALREDIFSEYTEDNFRLALSARARIVGEQVVSASGRRLFCYER
ncbi:MAG: class I SAM-dependent methyltransferase [Burkholderiales bacterium]